MRNHLIFIFTVILFWAITVTAGALDGFEHIATSVDTCVTPYGPPSRYAAGFRPVFVTIGDFNNDTKLDIAVANHGECTASILLGNGNGTFQDQQNIGYMIYGYPIFITTDDFNNDNKLDLALTTGNDQGNSVNIFLDNGDGTFAHQNTYRVGTTPTSIAIRDFNGDAQLDLVVTNSENRSLSILFGNGNGTFQDQITTSVGNLPVFLIAGYFNNDNNLDIAVVNMNDNTVSVLLDYGNGTFQNSQAYAVGYIPVSIAIGDFNSDNNLDIVTANGGEDSVSVMFGNGYGTFSNLKTYQNVNSPGFVTTGDFNNGSKLDIVPTQTEKR